MTNDRFDIHQHITNQIIAAIEQGVGEFQLPWHKNRGDIFRPKNATTSQFYRGVNVLALWAASEQRGFNSGQWATYRQWASIGAQVRKGEKSTYIVFYKQLSANEETDEARLIARASPVFAAEQVDGYAPDLPEAGEPVDPIETAEQFVTSTKATVIHGGDRAFYRRTTDDIHLPSREAFIGTATISATESYYATLLHELTHWTSHASRCDRELGKRFGDQAYAMEELIAELGAAFLCAELGIASETRPDHSQYLSGWLSVLQNDKRAIFTAASKASAACDFLRGLQPPD